jgi:hypothetical protein
VSTRWSGRHAAGVPGQLAQGLPRLSAERLAGCTSAIPARGDARWSCACVRKRGIARVAAQRPVASERWRILPAGGATNVPAFVALIGVDLQATVLIDSTPAGVAKLRALTDKGLLPPKRLLLTDTFSDGVKNSDIEDLFSPGDYLKLYNAAFGTRLKVGELNGSDRIIARIGRATDTPFTEHGRPADALLRKRDTLLPGLSETTLGRFEQLFNAINGTLT